MSDADRIRLAERTAADYAGYGYAPLFTDDLNAVAGVGNDIAASVAGIDSAVSATAADRAQTSIFRTAAAASASAAAGTVPSLTNRNVGRSINDTSIWSMVRSTPAWGFGPTGQIEETAIDTIRWDFNPTTRAPLGVAFAGARTNSITNPLGEDGTPGTPGTRPPGWPIINNAASVEYIGTTVRGGVPGQLIRFFGVPGAVPASQVIFFNAAVAHTLGHIIVGTVYIELVAGTLTNASGFSFRTDLSNDGGTTFTPGALAQIRRTRTTTVSSSSPGIRWVYNNTVDPVEFTLFIGWPTLEVNVPFASSPIRPPIAGYGAASTRAQGNVSIPVAQLGTRYNYRQGTMIVDWSSQPGAFTSANDLDFFGIVSLGDLSAGNVMGLLTNPAHNSVVFRRTVGALPQDTAGVSVTAPAAGVITRAAFSWDIDIGLMQVAAQGVVGTQLTGQANIPPITHVMPGRYSTTRPLFGTIAGLEIRPAAVFGSSLAALT